MGSFSNPSLLDPLLPSYKLKSHWSPKSQRAKNSDCCKDQEKLHCSLYSKEIYPRALKTSSPDQFGEITFPTSSGLSTVNIMAEYMVHRAISNGLCLCALLSLYLFCFWQNSNSIKIRLSDCQRRRMWRLFFNNTCPQRNHLCPN